MYEYLEKYREHFPERKFYQLIDKVYDMNNLKEAWKKVKSNKGCAGVDAQSIQDFQVQKDRNLREIQRAIKNGNYKVKPVLRKLIPKGDNRFRPLGIPTVKDRIVQQATKNVIEQIFEMKFLDCSYGFRPDRSTHQAVEQIRKYAQQGYTWIIDADIAKFFDTVNHKMLISFVAEEISDGKVLNLIEAWLEAGVMNEGIKEETIEGTPQGGVISPLLANIYLHEMDKQVNAIDDVILVRYADDMVILCKTEEVAKRTRKQVEEILKKLKLRLNRTKTKTVDAYEERCEFLGFKLKMLGGKLLITPKENALKKFKEAIRILTRRGQPVKPQEMVGRLNKTIRGWGNYFGIGCVKWLFTVLDRWIRTRVRAFIEKKKTRYANRRIPNHILKSEYKLASIVTLIKPYSL